MTNRYRLYVDESGDHVLYDQSTLCMPGHRYLALLGCVFRDDEYVAFHNALTALKQQHFPHSPDEPVILHRTDMINFRGPFWRLRDQDYRAAFEDSLIAMLAGASFRIVIVVTDKLRLKTEYREQAWHPYHLAMGFLMQRYCAFLNHVNRTGDVMAESRGRTENELLAGAYQHTYAHGDMFHRADWYRRVLTSNQVKLKPKDKNISGLQLADVLAHPLKQRVLHEHGSIEELEGGFGVRLAEAAEDKYNRHLYDGRVEGYGKVLFPK